MERCKKVTVANPFAALQGGRPITETESCLSSLWLQRQYVQALCPLSLGDWIANVPVSKTATDGLLGNSFWTARIPFKLAAARMHHILGPGVLTGPGILFEGFLENEVLSYQIESYMHIWFVQDQDNDLYGHGILDDCRKRIPLSHKTDWLMLHFWIQMHMASIKEGCNASCLQNTI